MKRQYSWKNLFSKHKTSTESVNSVAGSIDGDNVSLSSTTSAFPTASGRFPNSRWTKKFSAKAFMRKKGHAKPPLQRRHSETALDEDFPEELHPWQKSATLKSRKPFVPESPTLKKSTSRHSVIEEPVVIYSSLNFKKIPPRRKDMPICWEPVRKTERISKKRNILSLLWNRQQHSTRKLTEKILDYLELYRFGVCRLVCVEWNKIFDHYYRKRIEREWNRYVQECTPSEDEMNPFFI